MLNQKITSHDLIGLSDSINLAMHNHSIAAQLIQVLFKNYLQEDFADDKENYILFGISHDDICALTYAINEFVQINTPILNNISSECEKLYEAVSHDE